MNARIKNNDFFVCLGTLLYFVILFAERLQSIIRVLANGIFFADFFAAYTDLMTVCSLGASLVLLLLLNRGFFAALLRKEGAKPDYKILAITCGVLLCAGMVHTEFTIAPLQFGAYGALILAMVLRTIDVVKEKGEALKTWYSLGYLTAFSMAIPVMYRLDHAFAVFFECVEALTALVLVIVFTYLLLRVFDGSAQDLLLFPPLIIMVVLDALVMIPAINTFALIFAILSLVLFIAGKILFFVRK